MGNDEYIESGNVEFGVIKALKPAEQAKFERLRTQDAEVRAESLATEAMYEDLAQVYRAEPLPWLKNRIMGGLDRLNFF